VKDFDFEELDKAVNGLLNSSSAKDTPQKDALPPESPSNTTNLHEETATSEEEPTRERTSITPSQEVVSESAEPKLPILESKSTPVAPTPNTPDRKPLPTTPIERPLQTTPAARRTATGRFMDMVHPSSDMRSASPSPEPSSVVQPRATDVHTPTKPSEETVRPSARKEDATLPEIDSPFLPDTKVEKRPLGGSLTSDTPAPIQQVPEDITSMQETEPNEVSGTSLQSPEEGLAEVQVQDNTPPEEPVVEYSDEERVASDIASIEHEVLPSAGQDVSQEAVVSQEKPVADSIQQQYQEAPTAAQESGAIYDTEAYHQAFAPATKNGTNVWLILLWVGGLLVMGAAAGVAVYLFVLPML